MSASLMVQGVKNPPAIRETQEMWVQSVGWEDRLEEEMASHSSILAGKSHGKRSLAGYSPKDHKESDTTEHGMAQHILQEKLIKKKRN